MCVCVCVFVPLPGFSGGQPDFLSLWHTQQSFLLNAPGEWTRQHNGNHLGIMSCGAWQVGPLVGIWAPESCGSVLQRHCYSSSGSSSGSEGGQRGRSSHKAGRQQWFRHSVQTALDACRLPDVVCPQRDLQLPQDFGRFLHPPAKLLQEELEFV